MSFNRNTVSDGHIGEQANEMIYMSYHKATPTILAQCSLTGSFGGVRAALSTHVSVSVSWIDRWQTSYYYDTPPSPPFCVKQT